MLLYYEADGILALVLLLIAIILISTAVLFSLKSLAQKISRDVKKEVENNKKPTSVMLMYGKSYTTFFTGIAFSYALSF